MAIHSTYAHHPHDFEHHYIQVNGIRMHYASAGHGPRPCWTSCMDLRHGADGFRTASTSTVGRPGARKRAFFFAFHRGYNETDRPDWGYELDVLVQDVVELLRALDYRKAIIAGHDWGGNIAWSLAIARPELVERLIVLNIPHPALFASAIGRNLRQMLRSWYILFFQLPFLPEAAIRANDYQTIERLFRGTAIDKTCFTDEDIEIFKAAIAAPGAATAALNYYRRLFQTGERGMFRGTGMRVTMPTLMIWGEQDIALGKELTYGTGRFVPDLRIHYIPDCSHWVQQECPAEVNSAIRAFLVTR